MPKPIQELLRPGEVIAQSEQAANAHRAQGLLTRKLQGQTVLLPKSLSDEKKAEWAAEEAAAAQLEAEREARRNDALANRTTLEAATGLSLDEIRDVIKFAE